MKKVVRISLLALTAVALLGSCKKKNNEPAPGPGTGTGTNTGGNNGGSNGGGGTQTPPVNTSKYIELQLAEGQTSFTLAGLNGTDLIVEGATSNVVATDGNVTEWGYSSSATITESFTTASGAKVVIKGDISEISFASGSFAKLDLSQAPESLTTLRALEGTKIVELNLEGAKKLRLLSLAKTGITGSYDLTALTELTSVYLYVPGGRFTLPTSVVNLTLRESNNISNDLNLASFPNLNTLLIAGSRLARPINFSGSTKLTSFSHSRSNATAIELNGCTALRNVLIHDINGAPREISISGAPLLKEGSWGAPVNRGTGFATHYGTATGNNNPVTKLNLSGNGLTKFEAFRFPNVIDLDLSSNNLTTANFSTYTKLKTLNLLNNPGLSTNLTAVLNTLPTVTDGTLKIAGLSASDRAIATGKGWNVVAQ